MIPFFIQQIPTALQTEHPALKNRTFVRVSEYEIETLQ
jgi:hypothetical protein